MRMGATSRPPPPRESSSANTSTPVRLGVSRKSSSSPDSDRADLAASSASGCRHLRLQGGKRKGNEGAQWFSV